VSVLSHISATRRVFLSGNHDQKTCLEPTDLSCLVWLSWTFHNHLKNPPFKWNKQLKPHLLSHYSNLVNLISGNTIVRDTGTFLISYLEEHFITLWVSRSACFSWRLISAYSLATVNPFVVIASLCYFTFFKYVVICGKDKPNKETGHVRLWRKGREGGCMKGPYKKLSETTLRYVE